MLNKRGVGVGGGCCHYRCQCHHWQPAGTMAHALGPAHSCTNRRREELTWVDKCPRGWWLQVSQGLPSPCPGVALALLGPAATFDSETHSDTFNNG